MAGRRSRRGRGPPPPERTGRSSLGSSSAGHLVSEDRRTAARHRSSSGMGGHDRDDAVLITRMTSVGIPGASRRRSTASTEWPPGWQRCVPAASPVTSGRTSRPSMTAPSVRRHAGRHRRSKRGGHGNFRQSIASSSTPCWRGDDPQDSPRQAVTVFGVIAGGLSCPAIARHPIGRVDSSSPV